MIDVAVRYVHFWDDPGFQFAIIGALLLAGAIVVRLLSRRINALSNSATMLFGAGGAVLLFFGCMVMLSQPFDTGKLESAYGIEQLECSACACTWLKKGQPAAGTLVRRGDMAGLLDSNQKPLPLVNDEATR